jgi:salicylate 5-hydroxylase small subunit
VPAHDGLTVSEGRPVEVPAAVLERLAVHDLYEEYHHLLDAGELESWLELFTGDCDYLVTARENVELGLPLATIRCEGRGMLADRVAAIRSTQFFLPRHQRRFLGGLRVVGGALDGAGLETVASFLVVESTVDEPSRILLAGEHRDIVVASAGRLRFARKVCVYDAPLIPTSLVYPV